VRDSPTELNEDDAARLRGLLESGGGAPSVIPFRELLPPYPSVGVVGPAARTPAQPMFDGRERRNLELMVRAYRCVRRYHTKKQARVPRDARFKLRKPLAAMLSAGVKAPYAWAMFRWVQFMHADPGSLPTVHHVFHERAVREQAAWFRENQAAWQRCRCELPPAHQELIQRWEGLVWALRTRQPKTVQDAQQLIEERLSQECFQELVERAAIQRREMEQIALHKLAKGEWVWVLPR
jgi:hypothetical protein